MIKREISKEELLLVIDQHLKQLKQDYDRIQNELDNLDLKKPMDQVREEAIKHFFDEATFENMRRILKIKQLQEDWKKYYEIESKVKAGRYGFLSHYRKSSLKKMHDHLTRREEKLHNEDMQRLGTNLAQRYIENYCRMKLPNVPDIQKYLDLRTRQVNIEKTITMLNELANNIRNNERDKFVVVGDLKNLNDYIRQIPNLNSQLNTRTVSIGEFNDLVNNNLKVLETKYQQSVDRIVNLSKEITGQLILKKQREIRDFGNKNIIDYDKIKKGQETITKFQKIDSSMRNIIEKGYLERLPSEVSEPIKSLPEYQELSEIITGKTVCEYYQSLIKKIPPDQKIDIKMTDFSSLEGIVNSKESISSQLKALIAKPENSIDNGQSKQFEK